MARQCYLLKQILNLSLKNLQHIYDLTTGPFWLCMRLMILAWDELDKAFASCFVVGVYGLGFGD